MTRTVVLHISGNRYRPLPQKHHTLQIWEELATDADEYHVLARSTDLTFSTSQLCKIHLHLVPSVTGRMLEFLLTGWLALYYILRIRPTHLVAQCPVMGGLPAALASRLLNIPLLVELHGTHYFKAARPGFGGRLEHQLYRRLSGLAFRTARHIRSLAPEMTTHLGATYGAAVAAKSVVVPTRVNRAIFRNTRSGYKLEGPLKIISVGGLYVNKNHAALIRAVTSAGVNSQLTIVGEGPERASLQALIRELDLQGRVRLTGNIDHSALARELNAHDVYVHYSRAEALSRAILEAMACGCPVVTTRVGFIDGVLNDHQNAIVIDAPWDKQLQRALIELRDSEDLRQRIGTAGSACIEHSFDAGKVFHAYRHLIYSMA